MSESSPVTRYDPFDGALSLSLATKAGGVVYTSGMLGTDAQFNVPADVEEEFGQNLPASTSVRVAQLLHPSAHVEVKMIAALPAN